MDKGRGKTKQKETRMRDVKYFIYLSLLFLFSLSYWCLDDWQKEEVRKGHYSPYNFEEDDSDEEEGEGDDNKDENDEAGEEQEDEEEDADQEESFSLNLGIGIVEIAHENEQKWLIYDKKDHKYVCTFSMEPYHFISNYNTKYTDDMATGSNDTTAFNDSCVNLSLFDARFERKNPH